MVDHHRRRPPSRRRPGQRPDRRRPVHRRAGQRSEADRPRLLRRRIDRPAKDSLRAEEVVLDRQYGKKKLDTDFSGFAGFMKLMEADDGGRTHRRKSSKYPQDRPGLRRRPDHVGRKRVGSLRRRKPVGSDTLVKALRDAKQSDRVKAIVLRVDSPGGSALASDLIWREVATSEKPVVASMGNVGGQRRLLHLDGRPTKSSPSRARSPARSAWSAARWPSSGLLDKVGINVDVISRGKNAGSFSIVDRFTDIRTRRLEADDEGHLPPVHHQGRRGPQDGRGQDRIAGPGPHLHRPDGRGQRAGRQARHAERRRGRGQSCWPA